ncbi:MAG: hypothetical protein OEZ01_10195 [Candidatus Heimdallarchaeota archaeon]|nr:hypothetical protein [Candidatus Heimdallarchaeota archaeon]MDH5646369.1 hypothetical protein [Candidatus Heimdallarchaeota archaeon]
MIEWIRKSFIQANTGILSTLNTSDKFTSTTHVRIVYKKGVFYITRSVLFNRLMQEITFSDHSSLLLQDDNNSHIFLLYGNSSIIEKNLDEDWKTFDTLPTINLQDNKSRMILESFLSKRSIIQFIPNKITAWKNGDYSKEPQIIDIELIL